MAIGKDAASKDMLLMNPPPDCDSTNSVGAEVDPLAELVEMGFDAEKAKGDRNEDGRLSF